MHQSFNLPLFCMLSVSCTPTMIMAEEDFNRCVVEPFAAEEGVNQYQYDSFSFDGNFIAVGWDKGEEGRGTYLLNLNTGERTDVPGFNNGATFSPDGKYLVNSVYVENGKTDIVRYEIVTGETTVLAEHEQWDWLPSYSPDGKSILFNSFRTGNSDIYLFDIDTQELLQLTDSEAYEAHGQFSPDGKKVLYHINMGEGDFNIKSLDLETGQTTMLTQSRSEESYGSWSPDGKYIAFASDRDQEQGVNDIFIMSAEGELLRQITRDPAKDGYPFWSPDGRYLYFNSSREPAGIYRVMMHNVIDCKTD